MKETQTDRDEQPETVEPDDTDDADERWPRRRRRRPLVRRVGGHVETRFSYGVLTLSTFGFEAAALLIVIAVVGALVLLAQGGFCTRRSSS